MGEKRGRRRFVPISSGPEGSKHNAEMTPKRESQAVRRRLSPFFEPGNYTNVHGLCLFGY